MGYCVNAKIQEVPISALGNIAHSVIFSSLAKVQDDKKQFNLLFNKISTALSAIMGFLSLFIVFYSKNIITILFGEQWLGSFFFLQILIVVAFFHIHETYNHVIFKTFDQTQKILYLEIVKKIIQSISIIIGIIFLDITILLYGYLFTSIISYSLNLYYARKETNESFSSELFKISKIIFSACITAILLFVISFNLNFEGYFNFALLPFMVITYFMLLKIMNVFNVVEDAKSIYQNVLKKK